MPPLSPKHKNYGRLALCSVLIAVCASIAIFVWEGWKGFNLGDEGYLWYGAQRVLHGEVPLRDFLAYDPGRYYWSATIFAIASNSGIIALRVAIALMQALGLSVALILIGIQSPPRWRTIFPYLVLSAIILAMWMFPRHKTFDLSVSICLVAASACLVGNPIRRNYFLTGVVVGLAAVFGRNHGAYGALVSFGVIAWLAVRPENATAVIRGCGYWIAGVVVGFSPVLMMLILVPGFSTAFWESVRFIFELRATNLPLPVPWPWKADFTTTHIQALRELLVGVYFVSLLLFPLLAISTVFLRRWNRRATEPVLVAAAISSLPYAHYAFSRADVGHLAQGSFPMLIGVLALLLRTRPLLAGIAGGVLMVTSAVVVAPQHPGWQCHDAGACVDVQIGNSTLQVPKGVAADVDFVNQLVRTYASDGQPFVIAPFWPSAYAMFQRVSPIWEIYPILPRPPAFEEAEIERIETMRPTLIVIINTPLDGREDLRYSNTHPLTYRYIRQHYTRIPLERGDSYEAYARKRN